MSADEQDDSEAEVEEIEVLVNLRIRSTSDPYDVADRVSHAVHSHVPDLLISVSWDKFVYEEPDE